jgi:putative acetyltransferase
MIRIIRTNEEHEEYRRLVGMLDEYLAKVDGPDHEYYAHLNSRDVAQHVVLAYTNGGAVACGAIRPLESGAMEIKRMFVLPAWRGKGIAGLILAELEQWAGDFGADRCVLETGRLQAEAIGLYMRHGYVRIRNFGPFIGVENSLCFEKRLG